MKKHLGYDGQVNISPSENSNENMLWLRHRCGESDSFQPSACVSGVSNHTDAFSLPRMIPNVRPVENSEAANT